MEGILLSDLTLIMSMIISMAIGVEIPRINSSALRRNNLQNSSV